MRTKEEQEAYSAGIQHYLEHGYRKAPLSGEWAGESIPELSSTYNVDLADSWLADQFEDGYWYAFSTVDRSKRRSK